MAENTEELKQLTDKLDVLSSKQVALLQEIESLREEVRLLHDMPYLPQESPPAEVVPSIAPPEEINIPPVAAITAPQPRPEAVQAPVVENSNVEKSSVEKFIGENLINKIGVVITVIGVAIGAKYAIDHELISPLTRIVLGYLFGLGLLGVAFRLKQNYESFSAALLSGAMAILYFITFAAYDFYSLIPRIPAFALMVVFTAFTTRAAIHYKRQIIAHVGLVGAYAVPFLLSDGSGNILVLFSYIAIINTGILVVSFKQYWKPLYYVSFSITWLIYASWYVFRYHADSFALAHTFATLFFLIFYAVFLSYKLLRKGNYNAGDIILLLANSFIFYGFGYAILNGEQHSTHLLGLFTLLNAIIHFTVGGMLYRRKMVNDHLFYWIICLVLVFITIAIPVQLNGNWVTLAWAGEAAALFWLGRTRKVPMYEQLSLPVMLIAFFSIIHDWGSAHSHSSIWNIDFLSSLLFAAAFALICFLHRKHPADTTPAKPLNKFIPMTATAIFLISLYAAFYIEIAHYWTHLFDGSQINTVTDDYPATHYNLDLLEYKRIWLINYSLLFLSALSFVNLKKIRSTLLGYMHLGLNVFAMLFFLIGGLYSLSELRESYLYPSEYFYSGAFNIGIRYISILCAAVLLALSYRHVRDKLLNVADLQIPFDLFLHMSVLWIASSELINCLDIAATQSYKLGLSILWGVYSLLLIAWGIRQKKKHLRIGAIALFGVTLVKLFLYDISHLETIAKTVVFVSLGILLLVISFLYNKYKHLIR
jgi:uncharacterized membrane protein